jgi:hypothetical protein
MRQLQLFTSSELARMRDRTASRNYSPERDQFRREHERHRSWGLARRQAEKLSRARAADSNRPPVGGPTGTPRLQPAGDARRPLRRSAPQEAPPKPKPALTRQESQSKPSPQVTAPGGRPAEPAEFAHQEGAAEVSIASALADASAEASVTARSGSRSSWATGRPFVKCLILPRRTPPSAGRWVTPAPRCRLPKSSGIETSRIRSGIVFPLARCVDLHSCESPERHVVMRRSWCRALSGTASWGWTPDVGRFSRGPPVDKRSNLSVPPGQLGPPRTGAGEAAAAAAAVGGGCGGRRLRWAAASRASAAVGRRLRWLPWLPWGRRAAGAAVWQCGSAAVWRGGGVAGRRCGGAAGRRCGGAAVWQCGGAAVRRGGSAAVRQCGGDRRCRTGSGAVWS